jgi:hypothetical protein
MHASPKNCKPHSPSTCSSHGALSIADGLLCPNCNRAIQTYDFDPIDRSAFRIICAGCHCTLLAYGERHR